MFEQNYEAADEKVSRKPCNAKFCDGRKLSGLMLTALAVGFVEKDAGEAAAASLREETLAAASSFSRSADRSEAQNIAEFFSDAKARESTQRFQFSAGARNPFLSAEDAAEPLVEKLSLYQGLKNSEDGVKVTSGDEDKDSLSYEDWKKKKKTNAAEQIRVLSFNIAEEGKFGLPGVIDLIRNSKADLIGLQESGSSAAKIAAALGFNYVEHGYSAVLSRYKVDSVTSGGNGIIVHTPGGRKIAFFDKHLFYKPYQPYQLLGIPYEGGAFIKTEAEAIEEAKKARGSDVDDVRQDIASIKDPSLPTILVGDFNEPSFLDWTNAAAGAGRHPVKVDWPSSRAFAADGFKDSYRQIYPDEMAHPGYTWTPTTTADDTKDHHDRIDYVLYRGNGIKLKSVEVIGENAQNGDLVVSPFPSDHRALTALFEIDEAPDTDEK